MKKRPYHLNGKSALDALISTSIVLANNPLTQQVVGLLALILLTARGLML